MLFINAEFSKKRGSLAFHLSLAIILIEVTWLQGCEVEYRGSFRIVLQWSTYLVVVG